MTLPDVPVHFVPLSMSLCCNIYICLGYIFYYSLLITLCICSAQEKWLCKVRRISWFDLKHLSLVATGTDCYTCQPHTYMWSAGMLTVNNIFWRPGWPIRQGALHPGASWPVQQSAETLLASSNQCVTGVCDCVFSSIHYSETSSRHRHTHTHKHTQTDHTILWLVPKWKCPAHPGKHKRWYGSWSCFRDRLHFICSLFANMRIRGPICPSVTVDFSFCQCYIISLCWCCSAWPQNNNVTLTKRSLMGIDDCLEHE